MATFVVFAVVAATPAESAEIVEGKPKFVVWRSDRHQQAGGYVDNGAGGTALQLTWKGGGRSLMEVMFSDRPEVADWSAGMAVSLWVRDTPPGGVKAMALRLIDEAGEVYQFGARLNQAASGWQELSWTLDPKLAESVYGGDKNRVFNGSPRWFGWVAVTREKPTTPVTLWVSDAEGGDVKPSVAAESAGGERQAPARSQTATESLPITGEPGAATMDLVLVSPESRATAHAARRKQQAIGEMVAGQPWREARWEQGGADLMELIFNERPELSAFDAGVTLSIPVETSGYPGLSRMAVRAVDANKEVFQWPIRLDDDASGWRDVRLTLAPDTYESSYGGPADRRGQIDPPLRLQSLLIKAPDRKGGSVKLGTISRNAFDVDDISPNARLARVKLDLDRTAEMPLYRADENQPVTFTLTNTGVAEANFELSLAFAHFDGSTLEWEMPEQTLAPGESLEVSVDDLLEKTGWYEMTPVLRTEGGEVELASAPLLYLAPAGPRDHPPAEGFWLGIDARIGPPKRDGWQAELASLIGADYLRAGHTWARVQPDAADEFVWDGLDEQLALLDSHGLKAIYGLTFTPTWAAPEGSHEDYLRRVRERGLSLKTEPAPSRVAPDPDAWRDFIAAFAERYGSTDQIFAYEVWNEPDLSGFYRGTTDEFLELMRIAHEQLKLHDPNAVVLGGGIATVLGHGGHNLNPDLIERSIVEGQDYYDAVALHQHGHFPIFQRALDGPMAGYRAQVVGDKPIYFTETGVHTRGEIDRERQAHELVKKIAFARARGAEGFTWFVMTMSRENGYGMVSGDGKRTPYPVLAAYNELAKMMRDREFVTQHSSGPGAYVLEFAGRGDGVTVMWAQTPEARGQSVVFRVPAGGAASVVDVMGNATPLESRGGLASVELSEDVQYVVVTGEGGGPAGTLVSLDEIPADGPGQRVRATAQLSNPTDAPLDYALTWSVGGGDVTEQTVALEPGETDREVGYELTLPSVDGPQAEPAMLSLAYAAGEGLAAGELTTPLRIATVISSSAPDSRPPDFVLDTLDETVVNVNQADPNRRQYVWSGASDLSAKVWLWLDGDRLVLRCDVMDDVHLQPHPPGSMWKADGLQYGLHLPGQSRSWEFGVGLRPDGAAAATYARGVAGRPDPAERFDTSVEPIGGGLRYEVSMPVTSLGVDADDLRTGGMRFNVVVNDDDGGGREGWAMVSEGIARGKDSMLFPLVVFE